jgi:hypothetical protein
MQSILMCEMKPHTKFYDSDLLMVCDVRGSRVQDTMCDDGCQCPTHRINQAWRRMLSDSLHL